MLRILATAFSLALAIGLFTFAGIIASHVFVSGGDSADSVYITISAAVFISAVPLVALPFFLWTSTVRWRVLRLLAAITALIAFLFPYASFIGTIGYAVNLCALLATIALVAPYATQRRAPSTRQ